MPREGGEQSQKPPAPCACCRGGIERSGPRCDSRTRAQPQPTWRKKEAARLAWSPQSGPACRDDGTAVKNPMHQCMAVLRLPGLLPGARVPGPGHTATAHSPSRATCLLALSTGYRSVAVVLDGRELPTPRRRQTRCRSLWRGVDNSRPFLISKKRGGYNPLKTLTVESAIRGLESAIRGLKHAFSM